MTTNIKQFFIIPLLLSIISGGVVNAQEVPEVLANKLSATLDSMWLVIDNKSLSAAMQFNDEAVWEDAAGYSLLTPEVEVTTAHKYEIGSITKTLTGACVLQLVDEGILHLDDSVFTWLDPIPFVDSTITIRQLLQHKSGLYEVLSNADFQPTILLDQDSIWQAKDVINTFIQPAFDVPGSTWSYCNTGYFMLGMIIEAATGNPFYEEIRSRFLDPLELSSIGIPSFETYTGPIAHVWLDITGDGVTDDAHFFYYNWLSLNSAVAAAGGYYSTPEDITRWMRSYLRGDLHSPAILAEAETTVTAPGIPGTYGLGLTAKTFLGYQVYGHGGDLAYSANSWYLPEFDLSITVMNNDATVISWDLEPVTIALLQTYLDYLAALNISQPLTQIGVEITPNPFVAQLELNIHALEPLKGMQVTIINLLGQSMFTQEFTTFETGEQQIQLTVPDQLPSGAYMIVVESNQQVIYSDKLIKQ